MSINGILNSGSRGMVASQLQTQVASNNVAGAATDGYTRRSVNAYPDNVTVRRESVARVVEPFIEKRLLGARSSASEAAAGKNAVQFLDSVFNDDEDVGLGPALDRFQAQVQQLAASPDEPARRQEVVAAAERLSLQFRTASETIEQAHLDNSARIEDSVGTVNQRLEQISKIGMEIQKAEVGGNESHDLRDRRDQLIKDVAERIPISVMDHGEGRISVLLAGQHSLVGPEGQVSGLTAVRGADNSMTITKRVAGAVVDVTNSVTSGSIGGQLKAARGPLAAAHQKLDQLATDVANSYNEVHRQGVGLDGSTGIPLFEPPVTVGNVARFMAVSAAVANAPEKLAAAAEADKLPSDNRNATALSALSERKVAAGGVTLSESMAGLVGFAGNIVQGAEQVDQFAAGALDQVVALHENVSGVSSDEEMVAMMKYQRAYQASLKVIQTADEMYGDLLALR